MNKRSLAILTGICMLAVACNNGKESAPASPTTDTNAHFIEDTSGQLTDNPYFVSTDRSPMDMVYFPDEYPKLKMANGKLVSKPVMRVIYSRPHLSRRHFSDILKYDTPWRLGANESTEIEFFRDVQIDGKRVPQGRYILYCIPRQNEWTIVINNNTDTWGLQQDSTRDLQRVVIPVTHDHPMLEYFTIRFEKQDDGANLVMAWDDVVARMKINW